MRSENHQGWKQPPQWEGGRAWRSRPEGSYYWMPAAALRRFRRVAAAAAGEVDPLVLT